MNVILFCDKNIEYRKGSIMVMTLQEICDQYYNVVYRHCLRHLKFNEDAAAEVTQQVFSVLCERWNVVENHPNIQSWLMKTANNKLRKAKVWYALRSGIVSISAETFRMPAVEKDMLEQILCEQLEADLEMYTNEVLSHLSESERILLEYKREKKTHAEIGELLGITEGAVTMRVVRLKEKIRGIAEDIITNMV